MSEKCEHGKKSCSEFIDKKGKIVFEGMTCIDGIKYVPVNSAMVLHTQIKEALKICGSNQ